MCEIERRGVKNAMRSVKVEYFSFGVLYYKTKLLKQLCHDIVATKKVAVRSVK